MKALLAGIALLVVLGVGFLLYSSPAAPPAEMTQAEIAQIEAAVTAVADECVTAMNNLDLEAMAALYDPASMHGNDGANYYATFDEWMTHLHELFGSFEELDSEWTNTRVDVLAPDAALFVGQSDWTVKRAERADSRVEGYITWVMRNLDGAWKITHQASTGRWTAIEEG